jgi:hypothetical protein
MQQPTQQQLLSRTRVWIILFMGGMVLSGLTAFPIQWELELARDFMNYFPSNNDLSRWYFKVYDGVTATWEKYPFIAYGTDWLGFAHLVIAAAFIGPLRDPVRNKWVIQFGMIACVMVPFLAFTAGSIRGIPFFWQLIDCSFAAFGFVPLWICNKNIIKLESL